MNDSQFIYTQAFELAQKNTLDELCKMVKTMRKEGRMKQWVIFRAIQIKKGKWKKQDWQKENQCYEQTGEENLSHKNDINWVKHTTPTFIPLSKPHHPPEE